MRLPLFVRVLMADALAAAKPPPRPRRILQCRVCSGAGEVAPLVEVWTCPRCLKGRDIIGERD